MLGIAESLAEEAGITWGLLSYRFDGPRLPAGDGRR
jgi:hypothetical protein